METETKQSATVEVTLTPEELRMLIGALTTFQNSAVNGLGNALGYPLPEEVSEFLHAGSNRVMTLLNRLTNELFECYKKTNP